MSNDYLSCAETAKLVRAALRESWPSIKFSVRSSNYAGGASIDVSWTDGPTSPQVDPILHAFSGAYFDGMIDYKGSRYHKLDGKPVHFGSDFIHGYRKESDALLARAIADVAQTFGGAPPMTVEAFRRGDGHTWRNSGGCELGRAVNRWLRGDADLSGLTPDTGMVAQVSPTLARVAFAGDDGYGQGTVGRNFEGGDQCAKAQCEARERATDAARLGLL